MGRDEDVLNIFGFGRGELEQEDMGQSQASNAQSRGTEMYPP